MPRAVSGKAVGAISCQGIAAEHVRTHREGRRAHINGRSDRWLVDEQPQREEIGAALCGKFVTPSGYSSRRGLSLDELCQFSYDL